MKPAHPAPSGVLVVDKPRGPTSHDVVAQARKLFATRQVGHAGTLDPMATGVLVLLIGEATKLSPYLTAHDKRYRARVAFGRATDTLDADGTVVEERAGELDLAGLSDALELERARSEQVPPLFSAISVAGKRAHEIGRSGGSVELAPRAVTVHELVLVESEPNTVTLELAVSKGYYVRSLARDLGAALDFPAHLAELRRLASGPFLLKDAVSWPPHEPPELLSLAAAAERALGALRLTPEGERRARLGQPLSESDFASAPESAGARAWLGVSGDLVAIGRLEAPGVYRVARGFSLSAR